MISCCYYAHWILKIKEIIMTGIWSALVAFWTAYGPWITAALIPTIITGLSISPKTAVEAAWVQKIWDYFKKAMNFLSVLTHKDEPGTFQLPLKLGGLLKKGGGPTAMLALVILANSVNCSVMKSAGSETKTIAIDCTKEEIASKAAGILPIVLAAITGDSTWVAQLNDLGKKAGQEVLACALAEAHDRLLAELTVSGVNGDEESNTKLKAINRTRSYISAQPWIFQY